MNKQMNEESTPPKLVASRLVGGQERKVRAVSAVSPRLA